MYISSAILSESCIIIIIIINIITTPMYANGVSFRGPCGSQRLCQVWKVVIKKVDDRNAERIMRTEILDLFVIKSLPTDVPVIS